MTKTYIFFNQKHLDKATKSDIIAKHFKYANIF